MDELKKKFIDLLKSTEREGIDELIDFLENKSDFFKAPASTRFHGDHEGGLLEHSLKVYEILSYKCKNSVMPFDIPEESIILIGLLHDICKVNFYKVDYRNQKTYDEDKVNAAARWQIKSDSNGNFIWETVPYYKTDEQFPFGHGDKSVYLVNKYITLTDEEAVAIRFHMGAYESQNIWNSLGNAFEKFPLALALHEADMEATHLLEVKWYQ